MKSPIILEGEKFDWKRGNEMISNMILPSGEVNWYAAFNADPGCIKCPGCGEFLWREGTKVECPECHTVFHI